jgi:hypothetical protein
MNDDWLRNFDFAAHNAEVEATWKAFGAGRPTRTPIVVGLGTRFYILHPLANPKGVTFRQYMENPDVMFDAALRFQRWRKFNVLQDEELGIPEKWRITVDFQNYYEAGWLGCPIEYVAEQVPDTRPVFADCPERVMEKGLPDPFGGLLARGLEYYERFKERAAGQSFLGRGIEITPPGLGVSTDGILTVSCNLFSPEFVCTAMIEEPARLHRLFDFVTQATIARMTAWRKYLGLPVPCDNFAYADDSVALISTEMFKEHVLPYHRRLCDAFSPPNSVRNVHLCGDATRHFRTLQQELNVQIFDTGFPVDFGRIRKELGPKACIYGGPHIEFLRTATPAQVREEVRRIMGSGVLNGGLFVLREGNNLAPGTPLENTEAMYHAGREFGKDLDAQR